MLILKRQHSAAKENNGTENEQEQNIRAGTYSLLKADVAGSRRRKQGAQGGVEGSPWEDAPQSGLQT